MANPSIPLNNSTRVFHSSCDPAPSCIWGVAVNGFVNAHGAVILVGSSTLRYTNPDDLRQLARNIELVAQRLEDEKTK